MKSSTKPAMPKCPGGRYMNDAQVAWFKQKLKQQLEECDRAIEAASAVSDAGTPEGDEGDLAEYKIQFAQQGAAEQRMIGLRREIVAALARIESGDFGYCEESGEEIGLERLKANPVARLCIEAQQRREHFGKLALAA